MYELTLCLEVLCDGETYWNSNFSIPDAHLQVFRWHISRIEETVTFHTIETKLMYRKNNAEENITYKIILSKR